VGTSYAGSNKGKILASKEDTHLMSLLVERDFSNGVSPFKDDKAFQSRVEIELKSCTLAPCWWCSSGSRKEHHNSKDNRKRRRSGFND
jgi:hypothetical protein